MKHGEFENSADGQFGSDELRFVITAPSSLNRGRHLRHQPVHLGRVMCGHRQAGVTGQGLGGSERKGTNHRKA